MTFFFVLQRFLQGKQSIPEGGHDTLGLIVLDADGNIAVGRPLCFNEWLLYHILCV